MSTDNTGDDLDYVLQDTFVTAGDAVRTFYPKVFKQLQSVPENISHFLTSETSVTAGLSPQLSVALGFAIGNLTERILEALANNPKLRFLKNFAKALDQAGNLDIIDPFNQGGGIDRPQLDSFAKNELSQFVSMLEAALKQQQNADGTLSYVFNLDTAEGKQLNEAFGDFKNNLTQAYGAPGPDNVYFKDPVTYEFEVMTFYLFQNSVALQKRPPPDDCVPDLKRTGFLAGQPDRARCSANYVAAFDSISEEDLRAYIQQKIQESTTTTRETASYRLTAQENETRAGMEAGNDFLNNALKSLLQKGTEKLKDPLYIVAGLTGFLFLLLVLLRWYYERRREGTVNR
jgi:hypothetical protein